MRRSATRRTSPTGRSRSMSSTSERRVRCVVEDDVYWGRRDGSQIVLADGRAVDESAVTFLAPVVPSKIIAVHLTYRSRVEEYAARVPQFPSYFMKPPSSLNGHRSPIPKALGARFLNYEGEVAAVVGRRMKGVGVDDALECVA